MDTNNEVFQPIQYKFYVDLELCKEHKYDIYLLHRPKQQCGGSGFSVKLPGAKPAGVKHLSPTITLITTTTLRSPKLAVPPSA